MKLLKTIINKIIILTSVLMLGTIVAFAQGSSIDNKDYVLLITSYAHDSRSVTEFTDDFETVSQELGIDMETKIESMGVLSLKNCREWHSIMRDILKNQREEYIKGIILIGQEAWATYLSLDSIPNIPFYGCKISDSGIIIPDSVFASNEWEPTPISTKDLAVSKHSCGATMFEFDLIGTMQLVTRFYPSVKNVAILTDNSYGGLSILSRYRMMMQTSFYQMKSYELDGRKMSVSEIQEKINQLPENTVLLLGAWRVGSNGTFYTPRIIRKMVEERPDIPIFTISGLSIRDLAIGGKVPMYRKNNIDFLESIMPQIYNGVTDTFFVKVGNHHEINALNVKKAGIHQNIIPHGAEIIMDPDYRIEYLRKKSTIAILISASLIAAISLVVYLLMKVKWQNQQLNTQKMELKISEERAIKSDRLKSNFLANLSHEINTPANGLLGFINIMEEKVPNYKAEFSKEIKDSAYKLLDIINKIVEFSKLDSGILDFDIEEFSIHHVLDLVHKKFSETCKDKGIEFTIKAPSGPCTVLWDKGKTNRILSILVENALKFTHKGTIGIGCMISNNGMLLYVNDTGIGICEANQKRIFEKFEKIDSFTQGTGLGLAYIKAIAEKSGGKASVLSKPDIGSRFVIEIPCEVTTDPGNIADIETVEDLYNPNTLLKAELNNSFKILVAEDSDVNFFLLKQIMKNHNLVRVDNGEDAVKAMHDDWYDLVLMDIKMPVMDGLKATEEIRKFDSQTPIIAVTAFAYDADANIAKKAGCNDFLNKPITRKKLYDAILGLM